METADDHSIAEPRDEAEAFPDGPIFEDSLIDHAKRKRQIVGWFLVYGILMGVILGLTGHPFSRSLNFVFGFPDLIMLITWVTHDSIQRQQPTGFGMKLSLAFAPVLAFPYYCFCSRGFYGLIPLVGCLLLMLTQGCIGGMTAVIGAAIGLWPLPQW